VRPTIPVTGGPTTAEMYVQIQQFYARQMRLLDTGAAEDWAETFTEEGVFEETTKPDALYGRAAIAASARARVDQVAGDGLIRRHWLGMLDVEPASDGSVHTHYYALAMATPRGGRLDVYVSTECGDELVFLDGQWRVRRRWVRHDAA
jgi:hypothetical protein